MKKTDLSRRDFNRLTMAAFGGVVAGSIVGCSESTPESAAPADMADTSDPAATDAPADGADGATEPAGDGEGETSLLLGEKHVCRGLNACKGTGAGGENGCAGQGACATFAAHECAGTNECKGQGGCGQNPGENACKGMGACAVPLKDHAWDTARKNFQAAMDAAGRKYGDAPAAG